MSEHLDLETRFSTVSDDGTLEGRAVTFGTVDSYRSTFLPSTFGVPDRVPMLWSHSHAEPIGSWTRFDVRADGLYVAGKLNLEVGRAREVHALLKAGDVSGLSVGFRLLKDSRRSDGVRLIEKADLREISPVVFAAVPGSAVSAVRTTGPDFSALHRAIAGALSTLRN